MAAPPHGGQLAGISACFGIPQGELLDFSTNLNPHGPPNEVMQSLRDAVQTPSLISAYPDLALVELRAALASYASVEPGCIVIANGVIPLLEASLRALGTKRCLLPLPAFAEYEQALGRAHVEVSTLELLAEDGYHLDVDGLLAALDKDQCDALLLANPQNPTGLAIARDDVSALIVGAGERGVTVLLDEAFIDYLPAYSVTSLAHHLPNLVVFRSVTKFFAMAGLRVAYAVTNAEKAVSVQAAVPAWPVTTLAALAAIAAVQAKEYIARSRDENARERRRCHAALRALDLNAFAGEANYLCFRLREKDRVATVWANLIARHAIVTRRCDNYRGLAGEFIRVGIKLGPENDRLHRALAEVLR